MRSLDKQYLRVDEETYRLLTTMVKKMKLSKKDDQLVITETVSDLMWLNQIQPLRPIKYAILLNKEEAAKIIYYIDGERLVFHDLYVNPKYRKQGIAKALITEVLADHRGVKYIQFHARETNKPVRNLMAFFVGQFQIPTELIGIQVSPAFYIDGGKAVIYNTVNPAHYLDQKEEASPSDVPETAEA